MKKIVKLTERDLMRIVKRVINENDDMMDSDSRKPKYDKDMESDDYQPHFDRDMMDSDSRKPKYDKDMESDEDMIRIPREYSGVRMELGTRPTPEDIISAYNEIVEEGIPLVSYSDGIFYNEDDNEIPVDAVLDELNYAIVGEEEIDYDNEEEEEDDMPSYKTKWRMPSDDDDM